MANTVLGYIFSFVGLGLVVSGLDTFNASIIKVVPQITTVPSLYLQIGGGLLILLGVYFMMGKKGSSKKLAEVPIYKGNQIVGYRRQ